MNLFATANLFSLKASHVKWAGRPLQLSLWLLAGMACLLLAVPAFSQGIATGSIAGTVTDPTGAVILGATVKAVNTATNQEFSATTNDAGLVSLRSVPPGIYKVTVTTNNFRTVVIERVEVVVAQESSLGTIKLELGQVGDTIQVEAGASLVEATTSQVATSFSTKEVADLPLSGSFDALALNVPGVTYSGDNNFSNTNGAGISSNGLRGRSNNFQIDGQSNNDNSVAGPSIFLGNQDALEEVSVITNDFGVEYGRASGSVVNYVTKSGSNDIHGSGFEYYEGSFADSHANQEKNPVFGFCAPVNPAAGCTPVSAVPNFVENKFGGSIGGPIKRDKAWFFFTPYFDRQRSAGSPSTSTTLTPTPNGLTQLAAAFPGNPAVAVLNAIGPYAVKAGNPQVSGTPGPVTVSDGTTTAPIEFSPVTRSVPVVFNDREFTGRVDVQITSKDRVGARYIFQQSIQTGATGRFSAGAWVDIPARDQQIALDWTHTFSSTLLNQVRYSFSRAGFGFEGGSFPGCTRAAINACPTSITFQSNDLNFGIQNNLPQGRTINNSQVQDNASLLHGHHTFKFGGEYDIAAYAGDDWRLKNNLTVNLGLRWEFSSQAINLLHEITVANQAGSTPFWDPTAPTSVTTVPEIPNQYKYFGPTAGFAWKPHLFGMTREKNVIRGGYRITYDTAYYNIFLNVATAAPVVNAGSVS